MVPSMRKNGWPPLTRACLLRGRDSLLKMLTESYADIFGYTADASRDGCRDLHLEPKR